jgi:hypothetical protein
MSAQRNKLPRRLSLYPLSIEDALRAAARTGLVPGKKKLTKKPSAQRVRDS